MNLIRTVVATSVLESFILTGIVTGFIRNDETRLTARLRMNQKLAKWLARALGLSITTVPVDIRPRGKWGRIILANHLSVLDVIALATLEEAVFVTSKEMGDAFGVGSLARFGGALFVERRNREGRTAELGAMEAILRQGRTIVLFPEATSGDGKSILRFRNGLLKVASRLPRVEILPVCFQYETFGGSPVSSQNHSKIFLFGEMSLIRHLIHLFTNPRTELKVQYLEPYFAHECGDAGEIALRAENQVREAFRAIG